jgi:hypothetical protein
VAKKKRRAKTIPAEYRAGRRTFGNVTLIVTWPKRASQKSLGRLEDMVNAGADKAGFKVDFIDNGIAISGEKVRLSAFTELYYEIARKLGKRTGIKAHVEAVLTEQGTPTTHSFEIVVRP